MNKTKPSNKKIVLFGAGLVGYRAFNIFGPERVHCFVDNIKAGQEYCGKPIISFDELCKIHNDYNVAISVRNDLMETFKEQCESAQISCHPYKDFITYREFPSDPFIRQFKNLHTGKRCFLIGNGPSLRAEDLTILHNQGELCFGCNAISRIFDKTPWRPDYFTVVDRVFIKFETEMLANTQADYKFIPALNEKFREDMSATRQTLESGFGQVRYLRTMLDMRINKMPEFSPDPSRLLYECGTVMYVMIQLALYMGFKKMYLLGVDGNTVSIASPDYLGGDRHFYKNDEDFVKTTTSFTKPASSENLYTYLHNAYAQAEIETQNHGAKIYNATRGGTVEEFERIDFDSIFDKKKSI